MRYATSLLTEFSVVEENITDDQDGVCRENGRESLHTEIRKSQEREILHHGCDGGSVFRRGAVDQLAAEMHIIEGEHATVGVLEDDDLIGLEELLAYDEAA